MPMTHMKEALAEVVAITDGIQSEIKYWQVSRDFNTASDCMANVAMDEMKIVIVDSPDSDFARMLYKEHHESLHERIYKSPTIVATKSETQVLVVTRAQAKLRKSHCDEAGRLVPWKRIRHGQLNTPWMKAYIEFIEDNVAIPEDQRWELGVQHFDVLNNVLWLTSTRVEEEWRIVIPQDQREDVLAEHHDGRCEGHLRGLRFMQQIRSRYYWPRLAADVRHFEKSCAACQVAKGKLNRNKVPLSVINEVTSHPFQ